MAAAKIALITDTIVTTKDFFDCLLVNQDSFFVSEISQLDIGVIALFGSQDNDSGPYENSENMLLVEELDTYPWTLEMTQDMETLLNDADFVICQLRHADEKKSLRFIDHLCREMERFCPDVWLINYSKHIGIVSQCIQDNFTIKSVGISDTPQTLLRLVKDYFGEDATMEYIGMENHGYVTSIKDGGGMELKDKLLFPKKDSELDRIKQDKSGFDALEEIGALPTAYLMQIIQMEDAKLFANQHNTWYKEPINRPLEHQNSVIEIMDAIYNQYPCVHIVYTPNNGALKFLEDSDVVEIAAHIGREGILPMSVEFFDNHYIIERMISNKIIERSCIENRMNSK